MFDPYLSFILSTAVARSPGNRAAQPLLFVALNVARVRAEVISSTIYLTLKSVLRITRYPQEDLIDGKDYDKGH